MLFKSVIFILFSFSLFILNLEIISANFLQSNENSNPIKSNDYLDFSYISFVIQLIIGGAVAGVITLIAYYRKFSDFIYSLFNKNKKTDKKK